MFNKLKKIFAKKSRPTENKKTQTAPRIAVVGAGLAGLTAAWRLHQKGHDVQVYEARPRVGGRVHTVLIKNLTGGYSLAELGGQNMYDGGDALSIQALAKDLGVELSADTSDFSRLFVDGKKVYDPHLLLQQCHFTRQTIAQKLASLKDSARHMGDVLDAFFEGNSILKRLFTFQLAGYEGSAPERLALHHNLETFIHMLLGGLSAAAQVENNLKIKRLMARDGNAHIPLALEKKLQGRLHLNKILQSVISVDEKIELTFSDGEKVLYDKVILAIPCPVYKAIDFDPHVLPPDVLSALLKVQYGSNGKIMMPAHHQNRCYGAVITDEMVAFDNVDGEILTLYFTEKSAETLNQKAKTSVKKAITSLNAGFHYNGASLALSTLEPVVPQESNFSQYEGPVVKSWAEDPFSRGSYANYGVALSGSKGGLQAQKTTYRGVPVRSLFAPVHDRLFFAGEHTTMLDEIGTMEAAVESGNNVAKQINALIG